MNPEQRTADLLDVAVKVANRDGWHALTRDAIAREAGCSDALVTVRLGTMIDLRRSVMRAAIKRRVLRVVAEGILAKDRHALRAPDDIRQEAAALLTGR